MTLNAYRANGWLAGLLVLIVAMVPTLGGCATNAELDRKERGYDIFAKTDMAPGNITVTRKGRVIVSLHQFFEPTWRVAEVDPETGVLRPFPNPEWAEELGPNGIGMDSVLGIMSDDEDRVWMLDNGLRGGSSPRLIVWNTKKNELDRVITIFFPGIDESFLNDFVLDPKTEHVYIANTALEGTPSLVVLDLRTGLARPVLLGDSVVSGERGANLVIEGETLNANGQPRVVAINPITIDKDGRWVYFGAMTGRSLYRIRTADLRNADLSDSALAQRVERYSAKPVSDGITIDEQNNIYVTDLENSGIGVIGRNRAYKPIFSDSVLVNWPDGLSGGPDGLIYATVNQLHRSPGLNDGRDASVPPYLIIRVDARGKPIAGR
ncbi:MAG: L-dopachrome tautomerase-related protein [Planctomycetota bacterium]